MLETSIVFKIKFYSKEGEKITCEKCKITFKSHECYKNHNKKGKTDIDLMKPTKLHFFSGTFGGKSRCDYTESCKKCGESYYTNKSKTAHKCGEKWCHRCNCQRIKDHKCVMPVSRKNEKKLTRQRVYFDIEVNNLYIYVT